MNSTIILGDLHLGKKHNVTYGDSTIWDYRSLELLKRILQKHNPHRLILAGDVFDTSKPSSLTYSELLNVINSVPDVWIIAGNHDISKVSEDIAFDNLRALDNVTVVRYATLDHQEEFNFIGWQPTQEHYDSAMKLTLAEAIEGAVVITHCSRLDFGNQNDNICTDEHLALAKEKDITIVSGHEHKSQQIPNFIHLGSVVPHTIAELGPRYYWLDGELIQLDDDGDIILTREEPLTIDPNKVYYVKAGKEITVEDLKLEARDLGIDIVEDFTKKAIEAGFNMKELLDD